MNDDSKRKRILEHYSSQQQQFAQKKTLYEKRAIGISRARLITFLSALTGIVGGLGRFFSPWGIAVGVGCCFLAVFLGLVIWHDKVLRTKRRFELLIDINDEAIKRMERRWDTLPLKDVSTKTSNHPVAFDLDLFSSNEGAASLFQLLGTFHTQNGKKTLEHWLLTPASPEEIRARQEAVAELAGSLEWRQELELHGRLLPRPTPSLEGLLKWTEESPWLGNHKAVLWSARLFAATPTALFVLYLAGVLPPYWILGLLFNLAFFGIFSRRCHTDFEQVSSGEHVLGHFAHLFKLTSEQEFKSELLVKLRTGLSEDDLSAYLQILRLGTLVGMADTRFSPMLYLPLQALFLWSFHVWHGLESWRHRAGPKVRGWFDKLGQMEALASLADLHHNHPSWVFPSVSETENSGIRALGLGHPLMHPLACVTNDVTLGPSGIVQLITGSNMSGKSTLLRAIGLNAVLAQAGGPVFAEELAMPPLTVATSFRIQDSLQAGVSFFMAELRRLKQIVDMADMCSGQKKRTLLYLLDEILQGTNTTERQIAVKRVLTHLIERGAIGAVSTHDLSLAGPDGLGDTCLVHHFVENYAKGPEGPTMHFDYTLRPGVAPTVNALKLLEIVGLTEL